jgi:hypothetical protein
MQAFTQDLKDGPSERRAAKKYRKTFFIGLVCHAPAEGEPFSLFV